MHVNRAALQERPPEEEVTADARDATDVLLWAGPIPCVCAQYIPVDTEHPDVLRLADACGVLRHRVEQRLQLEGRLADHLEDFAGGSLLPEGLAEVPIAGLQLCEQAHILDGDDRLSGERLEQCDLTFREETRLSAANVDRADGEAVFFQQRNAEDRAVAHEAGILAAFWELLGLPLHVRGVDRASVQDRAAVARSPNQREYGLNRNRSVMSHQAQVIAVTLEKGSVKRLAQPRGALRDRIEDGLHIGRRAADHAQDLRCRRLLFVRLN